MAALVSESTNEEGGAQAVNPMMRNLASFLSGGSPWKKALADKGFPDGNDAVLTPLFEYLEVCLGEVVRNDELPSLLRALDGEYIEPGPNDDPIRNPDALPMGRNMHALDPQSLPTKAAADTAFVLVDWLLEQMGKTGELPESIAFTLWGTDNFKT